MSERGRRASWYRKYAARWREIAVDEDRRAAAFEVEYAASPSWSAAASCAPNARARATEYRALAARLDELAIAAETGR